MSRETLEVRDVRGNTMGLYVTLNCATKGGIGTTATVTVKRTKYDTYVCLTCNTADTCAHSRFVEGAVNDGTISEAAA